MRYTKDPSHLKFRTKHWQSLWQSNIDSLASLKNNSQSAFVAIDTEGYTKSDSISVAEIGIAILPLSKHVLDSSANHDLEAFFNQNSILSYCFRVEGQERREKQRDVYQFGQVQHIKPVDIHSALTGLFASLKDQFQTLVLVGFDLSAEITLIATYLHGITQYISSWVDLQELAADISNTPSPSMRDTLLALGFVSDGLCVRNKGYQHCAGNDAVRELAVLAKFLVFREDTPIQIHRASSRSSQQENPTSQPSCMFWNRRPGPKEIFPFSAILRIPGGSLASIIKNLKGLQRIFAEYEPTAVGMNNRGGTGWVCLPNADRLAQFIKEVDGQQVGGVVWNVTTDYDPKESPAVALTPAQLREAERAGQKAQMDSLAIEAIEATQGQYQGADFKANS
ncbi:hypothetical protein F4821DRAFT_269680 [Hypoxylon rubiginosum]|uniref:Uncharacterized protein n=1 Tax=Hypoxylon rubiginosum TaxID=110542 RepID=A0ACC0D2E2_9PEZI|nr:hypothetical protein F4821DRAFT_269680 [Hypoxylon rubiginosum]